MMSEPHKSFLTRIRSHPVRSLFGMAILLLVGASVAPGHGRGMSAIGVEAGRDTVILHADNDVVVPLKPGHNDVPLGYGEIRFFLTSDQDGDPAAGFFSLNRNCSYSVTLTCKDRRCQTRVGPRWDFFGLLGALGVFNCQS